MWLVWPAIDLPAQLGLVSLSALANHGSGQHTHFFESFPATIKMPTTLFDTLKVGSLSVPSRIFMVTRPRCEFFDTVTFNLPARAHLRGRDPYRKFFLVCVTRTVNGTGQAPP